MSATTEALERWSYPYGGRPGDEPSPVQQKAHAAWADEVLFGGAAGPGKTDWLLAEVLTTLLEIPGSNAAIFRRTFPDLSRPGGIIQRLLARIPKRVGTYNASDHQWSFRNGSLLAISHLERDQDIQKYQGAEFDLIGFDQVEQFTEWQYRFLGSRLRSAGATVERMAELGYRPRRISTANPGGPGHAWVKARWIDPAPPNVVWRPRPSDDEPNPGTRVFIPGRLEDNPHIDPTYRQRLENLPEDDRRALLLGDWDVFAGQRFKEFRRDLHVIAPEDYPIALGGVSKGVGLDYGLDAPFVALWGAKGPDGLIIVYREVDGSGYTPTEQAHLILDAERPGERTVQRQIPVFADPSTWARQPQNTAPAVKGLPPEGSIAGDYAAAGLGPLVRAQNDRIRGAALVADRLRVRHVGHDRAEPCPGATPLGAIVGTCGPRLVFYDTCADTIRTLPSLVRDPRNPEDVDTKGDDHWYDAARYLLAGLEGLPGPSASADRRSTRDPTAPKGLGTGKTATGSLRKKGF